MPAAAPGFSADFNHMVELVVPSLALEDRQDYESRVEEWREQEEGLKAALFAREPAFAPHRKAKGGPGLPVGQSCLTCSCRRAPPRPDPLSCLQGWTGGGALSNPLRRRGARRGRGEAEDGEEHRSARVW